MDAPDWLKLTQLVEEYGHGTIEFVVADSAIDDEADLETLYVVEVKLDEDEEKILVILE